MIEDVIAESLAELLPLIRQYQEFYKVQQISEVKNREFFAQFGKSNPQGCQFIYRVDGIAAGFATVYFTFSSTLPAKVGVMNDLFTLPEYRGRGIGKALINHCLDYALNNGAVRLQWVTAVDNVVAQKLYDSLDAAKKPWLFYTYKP